MKTNRFTLLILVLLIVGTMVSCDITSLTTSTSTSLTTSSSTTESTATTTSTSTEWTPPTTEWREPGTFTLAELQEDFDRIRTFINVHPKLYTDESVTDALLISQRELLEEGMTEIEFYRITMPIIASLNCMHSNLELTQAFYDDFFSDGLNWSIQVKLYGGNLLVSWTNGETAIATGDTIMAIQGRPVSELIPFMVTFLASDGTNISRKYTILNLDFWFYYALFVDMSDTLVLEYIDQDTLQTESITLERENVPTYPQHVWPEAFSSLFGSGYAVLKIGSFYPQGQTTRSDYYDFYETFFQKVEDDQIEHVILDIRDNGGGDPMVSSRLFSYLAKTSQPYFDHVSNYTNLHLDVPLSEPHFDGELYVLINGMCGSTCGHFAALLKSQGVGVFLGEETGGSYSCTDSSVSYTLPNTRMIFRSSTAVWTVVTEGLTPGRGIFPDVELTNTLAEDVANIDSVMNYAILLIENSLNP